MVCVEGHGCTQKIVGNTPETIYEEMTKSVVYMIVLFPDF